MTKVQKYFSSITNCSLCREESKTTTLCSLYTAMLPYDFVGKLVSYKKRGFVHRFLFPGSDYAYRFCNNCFNKVADIILDRFVCASDD